MATGVHNDGHTGSVLLHSGSKNKGAAETDRIKLRFFEKFKILPESKFRKYSNGLKVAVVEKGSGRRLQPGMKLKVHYTGWLENGKKFDSSVDKEKVFEFVLGEGKVIKGWEQGMKGIKPGERRQLIIPARLAYGRQQKGNIPAGSVLIFNVEAVAVENVSPNSKGKMSIVA